MFVMMVMAGALFGLPGASTRDFGELFEFKTHFPYDQRRSLCLPFMGCYDVKKPVYTPKSQGIALTSSEKKKKLAEDNKKVDNLMAKGTLQRSAALASDRLATSPGPSGHVVRRVACRWHARPGERAAHGMVQLRTGGQEQGRWIRRRPRCEGRRTTVVVRQGAGA